MANQVEALLKAIADSQKDILKAAQKTADILKDVLVAIAKGATGLGSSALAGATGGAIAAHGGRQNLTAYKQQSMQYLQQNKGLAIRAKSIQQTAPNTFNVNMNGGRVRQRSGGPQPPAPLSQQPAERNPGPNTPRNNPRENRGGGFPIGLGTIGTAVGIVAALGFNAGTARSGDNYSMWQAGMNEGHGLHVPLGVVAVGGDAAVGVQNFFRGLGRGLGDLLGIR